MLWFAYNLVENDEFFYQLTLGSSSFFVGCMLGGLLLNKVTGTGTKSGKSKIRVLRRTMVSIFTLTIFGEFLLIIAAYFELAKGYNQLILFLIQLGVGAQYVALPVSALLVISVYHRVTMLAFLGVINLATIAIYPSMHSFLNG